VLGFDESGDEQFTLVECVTVNESMTCVAARTGFTRFFASSHFLRGGATGPKERQSPSAKGGTGRCNKWRSETPMSALNIDISQPLFKVRRGRPREPLTNQCTSSIKHFKGFNNTPVCEENILSWKQAGVMRHHASLI
jgi:hypothetical protein